MMNNKVLVMCRLTVLTLLVITITSCDRNKADHEKPNFLFILADDFGYHDLSCMGSKYYETPNIDRISNEGMTFTDGYATCQVCSPSRASIMTGQFPARHGITDWIGAPTGEEWRKTKRFNKLLPPEYNHNLAHEIITLPEAMKEAVARVKDSKTPANERRELTQLLSERRGANALELLLGQFENEKSGGRRIEVMNALQRYEDDAVAKALLKRYATMNQREKETAQNILSSRADWSVSFLNAVEKGSIKREDVRPASVLAMQNHKQKNIDKLVQKHWGQLRQSSEAKQKRMETVSALIAEKKGDAKKGQQVYALACAACHRYKGKGGNIGPNLDAYQLNNPGFLIPAVVDPSLGIREEYAGFNVTTKDDQLLTGFIAQNAPQFIVLRDLAQNSITLPRNEIKNLQAMPVSLMPEGLLDALTPQQVQDLFAFLMQ